MHPIVECMEKDSRLVVGLMSGTSADGVDAALCRITGHGTASKIEQLGFVFQPFSGEIRREILRLASGNSACAADFCKMNFLLGELYVQAVEALCAETGIRAETPQELGRVRSGNTHYVEFLCETDWPKDGVTLQEGETVAYRWVSREELVAMRKEELVTKRMQGFLTELQG